MREHFTLFALVSSLVSKTTRNEMQVQKGKKLHFSTKVGGEREIRLCKKSKLGMRRIRSERKEVTDSQTQLIIVVINAKKEKEDRPA